VERAVTCGRVDAVSMNFETNVFVNCPFDDDYRPLLQSLLFTVIDLGFAPRIALESLDSGKPRFDKIISLIKGSKYASHDLSRLKAEKAGEYYRLNMPFELGVDVGCGLFKGGKWSSKRCLILETEQYRYQAAISDLSNSDIAVHADDAAKVSAAVRNWLNGQANLRAPGPNRIWLRFNEFMADNSVGLTLRGFSPDDVKDLPVDELIAEMKAWVDRHR
jgi:hypothetical protein